MTPALTPTTVADELRAIAKAHDDELLALYVERRHVAIGPTWTTQQRFAHHRQTAIELAARAPRMHPELHERLTKLREAIGRRLDEIARPT